MTRNWEGPVSRFISWGCGVQSTTLAAMVALGELEPVTAVVNADPGWERRATYEVRDWYREWLGLSGVRTEVIYSGDIREKGAHSHMHLPFWTRTGGHLRRQCTRVFKIEPIRRLMREIAGFHPTDKPHPWPGQFELWLGISLDEWDRMSDSNVKYIRHRYPLVDLGMTRRDCVRWLQGHGLPVPVKSACIGCPFRKASEWLELEPDEFEQAVLFDELNRQNRLPGRAKMNTSELFLFKYLVPLRSADLAGYVDHERNSDDCRGLYCWT